MVVRPNNKHAHVSDRGLKVMKVHRRILVLRGVSTSGSFLSSFDLHTNKCFSLVVHRSINRWRHYSWFVLCYPLYFQCEAFVVFVGEEGSIFCFRVSGEFISFSSFDMR